MDLLNKYKVGLMMQLKIYINAVFTMISTTLLLMLGGYDKILSLLIFMVVADYFTGVARGFKNKNLSSSIGAFGIAKKLCIFVVIAIAHKFDGLGLNEPVLRTLAIMAYISNEGISLLENMNALGVWIPDVIKKKLQK